MQEPSKRRRTSVGNRRRSAGRRGAFAISGMGALFVVAGCAVGPDFKTPHAAVPDDFAAPGDRRVTTQTAVDAQWWKAFSDPTLDRLVDLAYHQNLPLQIAGLRIVEARAQLGIATGIQFPQQQAISASAAGIGVSRNTPFGSVIPDRNFGNYQLGFDATWELDFWGKYRRGVQAEAASLLASVADYYSALVSLTAEVANTYVAIRTFEVLIEQAKQNAKVQEDALAIAEQRFRNGATSELDPAQASTLLESTRATIPQLQIDLQRARNALSTLLGQPKDTLDPLLAGPVAIPRAPTGVAVGMPAEILRRRPDVRAAELLAAAQCARIGVAKADLYPSFSLFGSIGLQSSTPGKLFQADSITYTFGPQINWPIFNYGRLKNAVRVQDARFQQLLVHYQDTVLNAAREVEDALTGFVHAQEATVYEQGAVVSAQRSVDIAVEQYREGATDYERVLDAQRSLLQRQNSLAQSSASIATNLIALYKALGGGWDWHRDEPVVPSQTQKEMNDRTDWGDMLSEPRSVEKKENPPPKKP